MRLNSPDSNMNRTLLGLLIGLVVGAAAGAAAGIFAYPKLFPPQIIPAENGEPAQQTGAPLATAAFVFADVGTAPAAGQGQARAYPQQILFEPDFSVRPGPDYRVYLVPARSVNALTNVEKTLYVDLGALKAFAGAQAYAIPAGVDLGEYVTVVIWSRQLDSLIAAAEFKSG